MNMTKMNHLHSIHFDFNSDLEDSLNFKKFVDKTNGQDKQKLLSKMKRKKRRKQEEEEEEVELDNQEIESSNIIQMISNKMNSPISSNHNCYTINKSKIIRASNLKSYHNLFITLALFLFISINLLLLNLNVTQATSNINSVWLSKDDVSLDLHEKSKSVSNADDKQIDGLIKNYRNQQPASAIDVNQNTNKSLSQNNLLHSSGSERRNNWSALISAGDTAAVFTSPQQHLYTSSSSLQPAIVSLDQADDTGGTNNIKRSDSDVTQLSFVRSFNNSDDATLDQLSWNDRNHTTNSQVHFDEGDQTSGSGSNNIGNTNYLNGSNNLNPYSRTFRRQDNQNNSSLTSQHDTNLPPSTIQVTNEDNNNDNNQLTNLKSASANSSHPNEAIIDEYLSLARHNKSGNNRSKQTTDGDLSDIYYISDGDNINNNNKWNSDSSSASLGFNTEDLIASPEPPQMVNYEDKQHSSGNSNQARRRLHTSGTQYDFRDRERASLVPSVGSKSSPADYVPKHTVQGTFNDPEMLAYNGGDEDDENRLKSVTVKHDGLNLNEKNIDLVINNRPVVSSYDPFGTTTTTASSDRYPQTNRINNKINHYRPTTPMPSFRNTLPSYVTTQSVYPASKYFPNQLSSVPKHSRSFILQAPPTIPQRFVPRRQPTPVVSLITGGIGPDGVTRQDGNSIWNQFSTSKQSNQHRDKLQQQLLLRANPALTLPILNYVRSPVVSSAPGRHLGHTGSAESGITSEQNTVNQKPVKKSLLAALSNRFNNWVDASRGNGNGAQNSLENSFYNTNQYHVRRMRPQQVTTPWASSNYYQIDALTDGAHSSDGGHFYGDNSVQSSAAIRHPVTLITADNHHSLVRPSSIAYYPVSYQSAGTSNKSNYLTSYPSLMSIQQPTVSPAPSHIDRFYGTSSRNGYSPKRTNRYHHHHYNPDHYRPTHHHHHYNQGHHRLKKPMFGSEPSPASFIPVVAVSVTKTSPAPISSSHLHDDSPPVSQHEQHNSAAEIDNYLDMRVGNINRDRRSGSDLSNRPYHSDNEFGNYASGSMKSGNNNNQFLRTARPAAPIHEHTTTVKSAVFGYLPHQIADNPLLKAINILPQFTPRVSYSPLGRHHSSHVTSASDAFVNHGEQDASGLSLGDTPSLQDHHHQDDIAPLPIEEPPNLSLQLQANSFVQNDIAHPFMDQQPVIGERKNHHHYLTNQFDNHQTGGSFGAASTQQQIEPIEVYPTNQHHLHGFQLFKPGSVGSYLNQGRNYLTNPLLGDTSSLIKSPHLLATPNELNPILQGLMLANPTNVKFQISPDHHNHHPQNGGQNDDQTASSSSSSSSVSSSPNTDLQDSDDSQKGPHQSSLNKGKKRSSEFFANAGQLLLSALPLLLAPTLGLMFASTPNSVARYQGSNPFSGASSSTGGVTTSTGLSAVQHSLPSTYINSLNSGSVSNPSPAPVVFTPTPPGYLMTSTSPTPSPNRLPSSKSTKSPHQHSSGSTTAPNGQSNTTKSRSTTPKDVISLTTMNPQIYPSTNSTNRNNSDSLSLVGKHEHLSSIEDDVGPTNPTTIVHDTINSSIVMTNTGHKDKNHYDIGYEGVDYDAQFASLRKPTNNWNQLLNSTLPKVQLHNNDTNSPGSYLDQNTLSLQKPSRLDKNRHQYSEVLAVPHQRNKTLYYHNHLMDEVDSKLYPVSTWPPMRRKTVSLVTSNGNKTLLDSSDKYPGLNTYQSESNTTSITASRRPVPTHFTKQKVSNRNKYTTTSTYDEEEGAGGDDLEDTNLDHLMEPLDKINTTIKILTKKMNPHLLPDENVNNGTSNYYINSLFDLASEQSSPGNSKLARRKRDIQRTNKLEQNQSSVVNKTKSGRTRSKKVRKVKIKQSQAASLDAPSLSSLNRPLDYNGTTALGNTTANQLMTTLESNNTNSIDDYYSNEGLRNKLPKPLTSSSDNNQDQLRGDASKSKSAHIITTMITHADDDDDQMSTGGGDRGRDDYNVSDGYNDYGVTKEASELREQLIRKKMILDKIASNSYAASKIPVQHQMMATYEDEQNSNSIPYGPESGTTTTTNNFANDSWLPTGYDWQQREQNFSYGGRGRFPSHASASGIADRSSSSVPIEVIATKIKYYPDNMTTEYRYGDKNRGELNSTRRKKDGLVLNEDTKKALANFGSLLIKDTMKIPKPVSSPDENLLMNRKNKRKSSNELPKDKQVQRDEGTYGAFETSSTEPIFTQTTSFPNSIEGNLNNIRADSLDLSFPQQRSDNSYPAGDWHRDYPNNHLRTTRYTQHISPKRLYPNRSEDYERAPFDNFHSYRNHNAGYDSINLDHHVRSMRDRVNLIETDLPNHAPSDDRSTENSYTGNNIAHYSTNDEMKFRSPLNNQQQQYQRGSHLQTYKSDPTAPINSYSLYTMPHINRSNSANNLNSDTHQANPHLTPFGPNSDPYGAGSNSSGPSSMPASLSEKRDLHDHPSGYSVSGDSHVYTHSNGHYGPNRRDTPHQHRSVPSYHQQQINGYVEPRNHAYQHDISHHQHHHHQVPDSHQNEPYQFTTFAPASFGQAPMYHNHKPSGPNQYQQQYNSGDYLTQTKGATPATTLSGSNSNDHLQPPDSTPYFHQQYLPKFYQQSSEIRYPASTNRNPEMGYVGATKPIESPLGNIHYPPPSSQIQVPPLSPSSLTHGNNHALTEQTRVYTRSNHYQPRDSYQHYSSSAASSIPQGLGGPIAAIAANDKGDSRIMNEYFKRVQFSDADRDKLMASYLTCDGLLNDNDHCLERLSCEFSDKQNIEKANKLDRAVSSILLGHILINTYIPYPFKQRLKDASLFGHTQSGRCAKYVCNKLSKSSSPIN